MKQINKEVFEKAIAELLLNYEIVVDERDKYIQLRVHIDLRFSDFLNAAGSVRLKIESILKKIMANEGFTSDLTSIDYVSSLSTTEECVYVSFYKEVLERWLFNYEYDTVDAFMITDKATGEILCVLEDYEEAKRYERFCDGHAEIKEVRFRPSQSKK